MIVEENAVDLNIRRKVLKELIMQTPWNDLKTMIMEFGVLRKSITRGGIRLIPKNKKYISKLLRNELIEDQSKQHQIFTCWFNAQKNYFDSLEPFFNSEKHSNLLSERNIETEFYAFDDEYFEKLLKIIKKKDIDKFLLMSSIIFTSDQKARLGALKSEPDSKPVTKNIESQKTKKKEVLKLKMEEKSLQKEIKKQQKVNKYLESENEKLSTAIDLQREENIKVKEEAEALKQKIQELEDKLALRNEDIIYSNKKHLKIISELKDEMVITTKKLDDKNKIVNSLQKKVTDLTNKKEGYFNEILDKLDIDELIAGLNATDDVLELLNTVIHPQETDSNRKNIETVDSLKQYWDKLVLKEIDLVYPVLKLTAKEVVDGSYFKDWPDHTDNFSDIKCSLYARLYLADIFYEILRSVYPEKEV
jgi:hypothetical protein